MFPGQGSFEAGHGPGRSPRPCPRRWRSTTRAARRRASTCKQLCFERPAEELVETEVQQPALVATCLAINAALRARGIDPDYVVGHSVGEFAALGAAELDRRRARRSRSCASAGSRWPRRRRSIPARWRRSSASPTRSVEALCQQDPRTCGRRTTTAPASSSSRARRRGRRVLRRGRARGRAARDPAARLGRVPLAARRARGRAAAPGDRQGRLRGPTAQFMSTVTAKLEDAQRYRDAARRAADGAGAVHAGGARADRRTASRRSSRSGPATC